MLNSEARRQTVSRLRALSDEKFGPGHWSSGLMGIPDDFGGLVILVPFLFVCSPFAAVIAVMPVVPLFMWGNFWIVLFGILPAIAIGVFLAIAAVFAVQRGPTSWIVYEWINIALGFPVGIVLGYLLSVIFKEAMLFQMGSLWPILGIPLGLLVCGAQYKFRRKTISKLHRVRLEMNEMTSGGAAARLGKDGTNG